MKSTQYIFAVWYQTFLQNTAPLQEFTASEEACKDNLLIFILNRNA